jgi:hypothetical protein
MRDNTLDLLALTAHAELTSWHFAAFVYNLKRGNTGWVFFHLIAAGFDLYAAVGHFNDLREGVKSEDQRV